MPRFKCVRKILGIMHKRHGQRSLKSTSATKKRDLVSRTNLRSHPHMAVQRFYSTLEAVPDSAYETTEAGNEAGEYIENQNSQFESSRKALLELGDAQVAEFRQNTVTVTRLNNISNYKFAVDLRFHFGVHLPLLFTEDEIFKIISVTKLGPSKPLEAAPAFFDLPREIREKIYSFLPESCWKMRDYLYPDYGHYFFRSYDLTGCIGDPSGFYFPLESNGLLLANRQTRQEALPYAYRQTTFHLTSMDHLIKFLIAVGQIGRDNIESLRFPWKSYVEGNTDARLRLPTRHAKLCVQLLKQCKRLKRLRIDFYIGVLWIQKPNNFQKDAGIRELCSLGGIEALELCGVDETSELVEIHYEINPFQRPRDGKAGVLEWLRRTMRGSLEEEKEKKKEKDDNDNSS